MGTIKEWFIEVAVKKMGPSAIRGAILGLAGWLVTKEGLLTPLGILYDQATHIITINLDMVSLWAIAGLPAIGGAVIKMLNHQGNVVVEKMKPKDPTDTIVG